MIKEEKQLLFQDLCGRLPYDVIVQETFQDAKRDVSVWDCGPHYIKDNLEKVKPYLRPMNSMTEDEKEEYNYMVFDYEYDDFWYPGRYTDAICVDDMYELVDWLNAHHFDYRGLIEKRLALEAPNDMYNTK